MESFPVAHHTLQASREKGDEKKIASQKEIERRRRPSESCLSFNSLEKYFSFQFLCHLCEPVFFCLPHSDFVSFASAFSEKRHPLGERIIMRCCLLLCLTHFISCDSAPEIMQFEPTRNAGIINEIFAMEWLSLNRAAAYATRNGRGICMRNRPN